ncbi:MAG TPA: hypothetical protein VFS37_09010 [Conexibacter sp.]|nr:hypothetical protein [Conexibacter sp.]
MKPSRSGIRGFEHAERELERSAHRTLLLDLCGRAGVHGGPHLRHAARLLRYYTGEIGAPSAPGAVGYSEARFIRERVVELLRPYEGDERFPKMRRLAA